MCFLHVLGVYIANAMYSKKENLEVHINNYMLFPGT